MRTFLTLENRYELTCELVSEENLHVGSGREGEASDAALVMRNGKPVLPGSSLRGTLRSTIERLICTLKGRKAACVLFDEEHNDPTTCLAATKDNEERRKIEQGETDALPVEQWRLCPVCRLFGSTLMAARMKITDAELLSEPRVTLRDGVGIDRDTGSARENIKFTFDVLEPGAAFQCKLILENVEWEELALLQMMLLELKRGIEVGGKKNRGLGLVKLKRYSVEKVDKGGLREFVRSGKLAQLKQADFEREIDRALDDYLA